MYMYIVMTECEPFLLEVEQCFFSVAFLSYLCTDRHESTSTMHKYMYMYIRVYITGHLLPLDMHQM